MAIITYQKSFHFFKPVLLQIGRIYAIIKAQHRVRQFSVNCRTFTSPWGNEDTERLIEILAKYNVKTTFFVVGDWVDKYPESVKALHDAGHEVMSHSTHHDHYNSLTSSQIVADIQESCDKIEAVTGCSPTLIRCPYGEYDAHVSSAVRSLGMEPIQWAVEQPEMT